MKKKRPTVWILSDSYHDFSKAQKYGDIKFITNGNESPYKIGSYWRTIRTTIMNKAKREDYVVLSGIIHLNCLVTMVMWEKFSQINFLLYHPASQDYIARTVKGEEKND